MENLAQLGFFSGVTPEACYLYGLVMMLVSVWLAFNLKRPEKQD